MILRYLRAALAALTPPPAPLRAIPLAPMSVAFISARKDVGEREDPLGSNSGAYVDGLRSEVKLPRLAGGEWCAVFASVHCWRSGIKIRSRSAKRLVEHMARIGRKVTFSQLRPGMCGLSLHRRSGGWHVRLWRCEEEGGELVICCVGGNEKHRVIASKYSAKAYAAMAKMMATV